MNVVGLGYEGWTPHAFCIDQKGRCDKQAKGENQESL